MNVLILEDAQYRNREFRSRFPFAKMVKNADECIDILDNSTEPWDLLFLDHDLDGQAFVDPSEFNTGSEVVRWLKVNKPEIKKIVVHTLNGQVSPTMVADLTAAGYDAVAIPFLDLNWEQVSQGIIERPAPRTAMGSHGYDGD